VVSKHGTTLVRGRDAWWLDPRETRNLATALTTPVPEQESDSDRTM